MQLPIIILVQAAALSGLCLVSSSKVDRPDVTTSEIPSDMDETTTTTTTTSPKIELEFFKVAMTAKFRLGVKQFRPARALPRGALAACPDNGKTYCIDNRHSDATTCMYPMPLDIKICLDESCRLAPENHQIFNQFGEDSYCKDYQAMPEGRVCHWSTTFCTCSRYQIEYYDALLLSKRAALPEGFVYAAPCEYHDNYKGVNLHEADEGAVAARRLPVSADTARLDGSKGADNRWHSFSFGGLMLVLTVIATVAGGNLIL